MKKFLIISMSLLVFAAVLTVVIYVYVSQLSSGAV
jgi:hypothetical protein